MKGLGLFSVQKWAQNLRFSELGRNKWGVAGIEGFEKTKRSRNAGTAKFHRGCENLGFSLLNSASLA